MIKLIPVCKDATIVQKIALTFSNCIFIAEKENRTLAHFNRSLDGAVDHIPSIVSYFDHDKIYVMMF